MATCVAIVVLALVIATGISYYVTKHYVMESIRQDLSASTHSNAKALSDWVAAESRAVTAVSAASLATDPMTAMVQLEKSGGFEVACVGFPDKRAIFSRDISLPASYDPTSRPWYQAAVSAGKVITTSPFVETSTHQLIMVFAAPVLESGQLKAVVCSNVTLTAINDIVKAIKLSPNSIALLVDKDGKIVGNANPELSMKPVTELAPGLNATVLDSLQDAVEPPLIAFNGVPKYVRAERIEGTDWKLVVALDQSDAMTVLNSVLQATLATLVVLIVCAGLVMSGLTGAAFRRLSVVRRAMEDIGSGTGDLTKRLPSDGEDEVADISRAFNRFVEKLVSVLVEIRESSEAVKSASAEISQGNQDLSSRTEQAAASLEETAASMEELTATVRTSSDSAERAGELATTASAVANRGGDVVAQVVTTMQGISSASSKIAEIIGVIDGIAFQTNILALNAAVEAARAGEQGRGFAVVAGEVRTLAQRSAQAAKEIKQLITDSVEKVDAGTALVSTAGDTMSDIVASVKKVHDILGEISTSAIEQSTGISQINQAVAQLDGTTQQNAALVEEATAASALLKEQAFRLVDAVGQFKLDIHR